MNPRAVEATQPRRHLQWPVVFWLTAVWVLLWGNLSVANALSGLVVSLIAVTVFPLPPIVFTGRVRPVGLVRLAFWWAVDLVVASAQVALKAFRFGAPPRNAVIEVNLRSTSDLYLTITAELVSLVPGSLVIEARRSTATLYLHVLDVRGPDDVERARQSALREEGRVMHALAAPDELAEYLRVVEEEEGR